MSSNPYDYENRSGIRAISWEDFHGICKGLVLAMADFRPELILPIGRGGYYPGTLIAHMLQAEISPIRLSRRVKDKITLQTPKWLLEPPAGVKDQRVLIVDEICSTGETLAIVREKVEEMGARAVKSAVLYAHSRAAAVPDYIGVISDSLLLNPWDREIWKDGEFQMHPEVRECAAGTGRGEGGCIPDPG